MTTGIVIEEFRARHQNTLRGFLRVRLPSGLVLHDVAVHQRDGRSWVSPPGKPMVGTDGTVLKNHAGHTRFAQVVSFADWETYDRFSAAVVAALNLAHPEALR